MSEAVELTPATIPPELADDVAIYELDAGTGRRSRKVREGEATVLDGKAVK